MQDCKIEDKECRAPLQGMRWYPGDAPLGEGPGVTAKVIVNGAWVAQVVL